MVVRRRSRTQGFAAPPAVADHPDERGGEPRGQPVGGAAIRAATPGAIAGLAGAGVRAVLERDAGEIRRAGRVAVTDRAALAAHLVIEGALAAQRLAELRVVARLTELADRRIPHAAAGVAALGLGAVVRGGAR